MKSLDRGQMRKPSSIMRFLLKLAVSTSLMVFLVRKLSISDIRDIFQFMDGEVFLVSMAVFFVSNLLGAAQWHFLLGASGAELPFHKTFRFYFVGLFFNNFLPANIGGDAVKVYDVSKIGTSVYQVVAVTVLDRVLGIFGLCLLASVATLSLVGGSSMGELWFYLVIFIGCMLPAAGLYFFRALGKLLRRAVLTIRPLSLDQRISQVLDHLGEFKGRKSLVFKLVVLSLVIQTLRVSTHILVGYSLGVRLNGVVCSMFFVFVPLLSLAMIPPITINGLGVREGLGMLLFARAGIGRTDAFIMEFLSYFISVVISFLGWVFFVSRKPADSPKGE